MFVKEILVRTLFVGGHYLRADCILINTVYGGVVVLDPFAGSEICTPKLVIISQMVDVSRLFRLDSKVIYVGNTY